MRRRRLRSALLGHGLGSLVLVLGVACGGASETKGPASGGRSSSGSDSGGQAGGGKSDGGSAGKANGGSSSAGVGGRIEGAGGSTTGGATSAGSGGTAGSSGGRTLDPRCPPKISMGACRAEDEGTACQFETFTGCLCYPSTAGNFSRCQKVDPTCPPPSAPAPADAAGGAEGKVAPPPQQVCNCAASTWTCHY